MLQIPSALRSFAVQVSQHPVLGHHVRRLVIRHNGNLSFFKTIASSTTSLVELYGIPSCLGIDWKAIIHLADYTGSTLSLFEGVPILQADPFELASPAVYKLFPKMRSFSWDSPIWFETDAGTILANCFNNLVRLMVGDFNTSFLDVLAQMEYVHTLQANSDGCLSL